MGKFGIISLVCGIGGLVFPWIPFLGGIWSVPTLSIVAIVFGGIGLAKEDPKTLAIVGLILGIAGLIVLIILVLLFYNIESQ